MDDITLDTINKSIEQLNNRLESSFEHVNDRIDETNNVMRHFTYDNNVSHITLHSKIEQACRLIARIDKSNSLNEQCIENHLKTHKKEDERLNINGIKITGLVGNFGSAIIGAIAVLYVSGIV